MNRILEVLSVGFIGLILLFFFYGDILTSPNDYLFSLTGDGIRNYYTFLFHVVNDTELLSSNAMNYPVGESIFFLDNNPLLSNFLKLIWNNQELKSFPLIGIYNLSMLLSLPLAGVFTHLLLREYNCDTLTAIAASIAIAFSTPTILRMTGHFTLAYVFFIPLVLWLSARWIAKGSIGLSILIAVVNLTAFLAHAYLGIIGCSIYLIVILINQWIQSRKDNLPVYDLILHQVIALLPLFTFFILVKLTDNHPGRTDNPYGFLVYIAEIKELFIPAVGPIKNLLNTISETSAPNWESLSYLGLPVIIIWLIGIVFWKKLLRTLNGKSEITIGIASIMLYLYALGFPFVLGLQFLGDWFPLFKAFRSVARFVWPLYFVLGAGAFLMLDRYLNSKPVVRSVIVFCCALFMIWESSDFHRIIVSGSTKGSNQFNSAYVSPETERLLSQFESASFDAIIPIPFFNHGSDNFRIEPNNANKVESMMLSYHLNKPLVAMTGGRTSLRDCRNSISTLFKFFTKNNPTDITEYLLLLNESEALGYPEVLFAELGDRPKTVTSWGYTSNETPFSGGYFKLLNQEVDSIYFNAIISESYNNEHNVGYHSSGCLALTEGTIRDLATFVISDTTEKIDISFWVKNNNDLNYGQDYILNNFARLFINDQEVASFNLGESLILDDDWSQVYFKDIQVAKNDSVNVSFQTKGNLPTEFIFIDDLLIKPSNKNHKQEYSNGAVAINNFRY